MMKAIETNLTFKTEWSEKDFNKMEKAITKHFDGKELHTHHGDYIVRQFRSFKVLDRILGLAYTSSGIHACYSICNTELHYDDVYDYQFFIMTIDGVPYAELWDKDENEKYIQL